jgi:predicted chitinase
MIDVKYFYDNFPYRPLKQKQTDGLNFILDKFNKTKNFNTPQLMAYVLATIKHETADTYQPVAEYGKGQGRRYGRRDPVTGIRYYGRGFVQLTWKFNYQMMEEKLGYELVEQPELALDPDISWQIMETGMIQGAFTGKKIRDYINDTKCDYVNARRVINGLDCAKLIAGYAEKLESVIKL